LRATSGPAPTRSSTFPSAALCGKASAKAGTGPRGLERLRLALTALLTLPGMPIIYYGTECGLDGGPDPRLPPRHGVEAQPPAHVRGRSARADEALSAGSLAREGERHRRGPGFHRLQCRSTRAGRRGAAPKPTRPQSTPPRPASRRPAPSGTARQYDPARPGSGRHQQQPPRPAPGARYLRGALGGLCRLRAVWTSRGLALTGPGPWGRSRVLTAQPVTPGSRAEAEVLPQKDS